MNDNHKNLLGKIPDKFIYIGLLINIISIASLIFAILVLFYTL
jgi:hypothetical protein